MHDISAEQRWTEMWEEYAQRLVFEATLREIRALPVALQGKEKTR